MARTDIVIAEDHPVVRRNLRRLLEAEPDLRIAGEAADGLEAVRAVLSGQRYLSPPIRESLLGELS